MTNANPEFNFDPEAIKRGVEEFTKNVREILTENGFLPEEPVTGYNETAESEPVLNPVDEAVRLLKLAEEAVQNSDFRTAQEYSSLADRYQMLVPWTR